MAGVSTAAEHYDPRESRDPSARERDLFARLPAQIAHALQAPGWRRHLAGIEPRAIADRKALAGLPLLRKSDLLALQKEHAPFGGFNVTWPGKALRLYMSPGPIFEPQGAGEDFAGAARALFAAGFRAGDVVHNAFSYHLTPGGFMLEGGAHALGCAVIPGGVGNTEAQVDAIAQLAPSGYVGTPDFLKILLDTAQARGKDASSLRRGLVSGAALPPSLRAELAARGVAVLQCYAVAETGVIAYESGVRADGPAKWQPVREGDHAPTVDGMIVNEDMIVEIVRPGTGEPVPDGDVGEVVVTTFNPHYPMIRLATGDLSAVIAGVSPCGRTNMRIAGWMGRADQTAKVKGMFVRPEQIAEIARRHPQLGRLRLVITREHEQDAMTLRAEHAGDGGGLADALAQALQAVTKVRGTVMLVAPGSLPNDGKVIADERPVG